MRRLIPLFLLVSLACQLSGSPTPSSAPESISSAAAPTPAPIPSEYEQYTIEALRNRTYGGGTIEVLEQIEETDSFKRYSINYPSDDLNIHGFVNVPKEDGPFPVIVTIHGFGDPAIYDSLDYTTPMIDGLTQEGYIIFHPDLRGYPPSDEGDNLFRVGMAIDVLNLIALIKSEAGPAELFAKAAPENIGLLGHSMGGNIALRVLTVSSDVKATVLYATMGGDERKNSELLYKAFPSPEFEAELAIPPEIAERVSLMNYYSSITSPIQLHHGTVDETVPVSEAEETCKSLTDAGVQIECIYYPEEDHTFRGRVAEEFYGNLLGFYDKYLSP